MEICLRGVDLDSIKCYFYVNPFILKILITITNFGMQAQIIILCNFDALKSQMTLVQVGSIGNGVQNKSLFPLHRQSTRYHLAFTLINTCTTCAYCICSSWVLTDWGAGLYELSLIALSVRNSKHKSRSKGMVYPFFRLSYLMTQAYVPLVSH